MDGTDIAAGRLLTQVNTHNDMQSDAPNSAENARRSTMTAKDKKSQETGEGAMILMLLIIRWMSEHITIYYGGLIVDYCGEEKSLLRFDGTEYEE